MNVSVGDEIEVRSNKIDVPPRRGRVAEVIAEDPTELRVEWEDGHETVFFPHAGQMAVVQRRAD